VPCLKISGLILKRTAIYPYFFGVTLWVGLCVTIFFKAEKSFKKVFSLQSLTQLLLNIKFSPISLQISKN